MLYHQLFQPQDEDNVDTVLIDELRKAGFTGSVASAHDLNVFLETRRLISENPCDQCYQRSDFGFLYFASMVDDDKALIVSSEILGRTP